MYLRFRFVIVVGAGRAGARRSQGSMVGVLAGAAARSDPGAGDDRSAAETAVGGELEDGGFEIEAVDHQQVGRHEVLHVGGAWLEAVRVGPGLNEAARAHLVAAQLAYEVVKDGVGGDDNGRARRWLGGETKAGGGEQEDEEEAAHV